MQDDEACIDHLTLRFSKPIAMATLKGKVYSITQYLGKRPFYIASYSSDFRSFVFKLPVKKS